MKFSPRAHRPGNCLVSGLVLLSVLTLSAAPDASKTNAPQDLLHGGGSFERSYTTTPPWGGVDSGEFLRGFASSAPVVQTDGLVEEASVPVSVGVGDLNGDGLPDLIVADPKGLIWFFANKGTATAPKFTMGEIIPIWLPPFVTGPTKETVVTCNNISVTDFNGDGKPDIILGTFLGEVYFFPNTGTKNIPSFRVTGTAEDCLVPTRSDGKLWGNFLAPIYVDFTKSNRRDLILGEGTYSANNIYYYPNGGSDQNPRFSEKTRQILIRGMGREHLTPQMIDWNNDGMPDIMTGERDGSVTVFLCKSNDPKKFDFDPNPIQVKFGSSTKLGPLSNPVPADLNGDNLFDLVTGRTSGRVAVAYNKGKPGAPEFDSPAELKGTQIYSKYASPTGWSLIAPPESTYHVLRLVSGDDPEKLTGTDKDRALLTYEAGFSPPPDSTGKFSAKLDFLPVKSEIFTTLIPVPSDAQYKIRYDGSLLLKPETDYEISFWIKGNGWTGSNLYLKAGERVTVTDAKGEKKYLWLNYSKNDGFSVPGGWSKITKTFRYEKPREVADTEKKQPVSFELSIVLIGKGICYLDDVTAIEKK